MYYDNKSSFYIRQYGPKIFLIVFSIVLIISGLYIYLSSNNVITNNNHQNQVAENNNNIIEEQKDNNADKEEEITEEDSLKEEPKEDNIETISTSLSESLNSLNALEKSKVGTVKSVTSDGKVVVKIENALYQISLVGIDYSKSPSNISEIISNDLKDKSINISFDKLKVKDSEIYAYIYIGDELYNKKLLSEGLAILKVERTNTSLLDELLNSQLYARSNSKGIWSN